MIWIAVVAYLMIGAFFMELFNEEAFLLFWPIGFAVVICAVAVSTIFGPSIWLARKIKGASS